MLSKKFYICLIYRIIFLLVCGYGILLHFTLDNVNINTKMFSYFTVQSNILCFVTFLCIVFMSFFRANLKEHRFLTFFKGMSTVSILVTFIVFHFFVAIYKFDFFNEGIFDLSAKNFIAHYIVPAMVVLDWILFQEKGLYGFLNPIQWLSFPLFYFAVIMFRPILNSEITLNGSSKYPYFFMDLDNLGLKACIVYVIFFAAFIIFVGYIIVFIDKILKHLRTKKG